MRAVGRCLAAGAVLAVICSLSSRPGGTLFAQQRSVQELAGAVMYSEHLSVKPGELTGSVLYTDGKTPAAEVPVRVWSVAQEKFTQEAATDQKGAYKLRGLAPGRYLVIFGDRVYVDLRVDDKAEFSGGPLNIIIPRGEALFAQMAPERRAAMLTLLGSTPAAKEQPAIAGVPLRTLLIIGGGTATAVGTVVLINELEGGDHEHVSP